MESVYNFTKVSADASLTATNRNGRRKANGPATAALLIQIATEILQSSPTMRQKANITLTDLTAADKVRKGLLKLTQKP